MLSAFKNFGVTFLISALLFGVIAYFATGFVSGTVTSILDDEKDKFSEVIKNNESTADTEETVYDPELIEEEVPEGESFNFVLVTTDYRPDIYSDYRPALSTMYENDWSASEAIDTAGALSSVYRKNNLTSIILVRIDKERREFVYSYITPATRVYTSTGYHTLSEVYGLYGIRTLMSHIHALTGLNVDYSCEIDAYNFDELVTLLGEVSVNNSKNIYSDGMYYTMQSERSYTTKLESGAVKTDKQKNTYILGPGSISLTSDNLNILSSVTEHSADDLVAKRTYAVEILQKYISNLSEFENRDLKIMLAKLIMEEREWSKIDTIFPIPPETDENGEIVTETTDPEYIEPTDTESETETESETDSPLEEDSEETEETEETAETEPPKPTWVKEPEEPESPVIDASFTESNIEEIYDMIAAARYFTPVTLTFPCDYHAATEDSGEYFEANLTAAHAIYERYRAKTDTETK